MFETTNQLDMPNILTPLYLVGGWPTPLTNMNSSVGMMKFPIYIYVYIYKYIYGKINFMFQTTNQPNKVDTINIWNHQPANKRQSCWWFLIFNQQRTTHQSSVNMRATRRLVHNVMALWDLFSSTPAIVTSLPRQFVILLDISGCYNVASRAVWKLLERGCYNVASRADWKLLERGCDNVASRASWKFLEKDVTM